MENIEDIVRRIVREELDQYMRNSRNNIPVMMEVKSDANTAERLYTVPEAAELIGVKSRATMYRIISLGELRTVDISASASKPRMCIPKSALEDWISGRVSKRPIG